MAEKKAQERHKRLEDAYTQLLKLHGFGFQERVRKVAQDLYNDGKSHWCPVVAEFPVEVQGRGTRIDFILQSRQGMDLPVVYLVCECKRVNPARGAWCFCPQPSVMHNRPRRRHIFADCVQGSSEDHLVAMSVHVVKTESIGDGPYNIGKELRTGEKGDEWEKKGGDEIEYAATQVIAGVNGYIDHLHRHAHRARGKWLQTLIPVVFTTAKLFASDVELDRANLETGKVSHAKLRSVPWLVWQYNLSPHLKHSRDPAFLDALNLEQVLELEFMRSVCVVTASGIEPFLTNFSPARLAFERIVPKPPS